MTPTSKSASKAERIRALWEEYEARSEAIYDEPDTKEDRLNDARDKVENATKKRNSAVALLAAAVRELRAIESEAEE